VAGLDAWAASIQPGLQEHVANHLATALTKRRMSPAERRQTISLVRRVIDALGGGTGGLGEETYHSAVHALRVEGRLEPTTFEMLLTMSRAFQVDPERLLRHSARPGRHRCGAGAA
jgi:hypothetical protein